VPRVNEARPLTTALALLLACGAPELPPNTSAAPEPRVASEWPAHGGDAGGLRFAALDEIRPDNVAKLEIAWSYRHGDVAGRDSKEGGTGFQATPILVDGILYFPTPWNRVIALDPATGAERWRYDPRPTSTRCWASSTRGSLRSCSLACCCGSRADSGSRFPTF
jgi:glucose dehydrogenase